MCKFYTNIPNPEMFLEHCKLYTAASLCPNDCILMTLYNEIKIGFTPYESCSKVEF